MARSVGVQGTNFADLFQLPPAFPGDDGFQKSKGQQMRRPNNGRLAVGAVEVVPLEPKSVRVGMHHFGVFSGGENA
jgi:hypothetical protein